jgi:hypothetical protein
MATRYLYGDSSAFPLNENFLETLASCTDACSRLLVVDDLLHKARRTEEDADNAAKSELSDIDSLAQSVEQSLAQRGHLSGATQKLAAQVAGEAKKRFDKARTGVKAWRDDTVKKAYAPCGPKAIARPMQKFLVGHQLPYTTWGLRWKAGRGDEPVQSQVYAIMQRGLTATLAVDIPKKHTWAQPLKAHHRARSAHPGQEGQGAVRWAAAEPARR